MMRSCSSRTTDLVHEMEALKEDNRQLRAALAIYIEVMRRVDGARIHQPAQMPTTPRLRQAEAHE